MIILFIGKTNIRFTRHKRVSLWQKISGSYFRFIYVVWLKVFNAWH
jgi:hypothetical protein